MSSSLFNLRLNATSWGSALRALRSPPCRSSVFCSRASIASSSYPVRANPVVSGACTSGLASPTIRAQSSRLSAHRQTALRDQLHGTLDRDPNRACPPLANGCSDPAADLRAHAGRPSPDCRRRYPDAAPGRRWSAGSAPSAASPDCWPGLRACRWSRLQHWCHLSALPSAFCSCAVDDLAHDVAEDEEDDEEAHQSGQEDHDAANVDVGRLVARRLRATRAYFLRCG